MRSNFPDDVWDGSSATRRATATSSVREIYSEPDGADWEAVVDEVIATQEYVKALNVDPEALQAIQDGLSAKASLDAPTFTDGITVDIETGPLTLDSSTVTGTGKIAMVFKNHPTLPSFNLVSQAVPQSGQDPNLVVSFGHNVGATGRIDDSKPYFRDGFESGFWANYNGPDEYFSERHVGSLGWSDAGEIRMLSMVCGHTTRKASAFFKTSTLTVEAEEGTGPWLGNSWDGTTTHLYLTRPGEGHTLDVQGNATADNFYFGRNSKTTSMIINGTQPLVRLFENGVDKHSFSSISGVLYLDGGNLGFFDTANTSGTLFTKLGIGGGFFNPTSQLDVRSNAANLVGIRIRAFNSQSANLTEWQDSAGVVGASISAAYSLSIASVTIGGGTKLNKLLSATATLDFGSVAAQSSLDLPVVVTGAVAGDTVIVSPFTTPADGVTLIGTVTGVDTVSVRCLNGTASPVDPASSSYRVTLIKF